MKKVTFVLLAAGLVLAACSKHAATENSSVEINGTDLNAADNLSDTNATLEDNNVTNLS